MFILIKNADIYAPEPLGISSLLISHDKIAWLGKNFPAEATLPDLEIIDAAGKILIPGMCTSSAAEARAVLLRVRPNSSSPIW